jgi:hypothetical protein
MLRHLLLVILVAAVTPAYAGETSHGIFNLQRQIGVAESNKSGDGCLTIVNAGLREKETIHLITLEEPQTLMQAIIVNKLSQNCSRNTEVPVNTSFYSFRTEKRAAKLMGPAIALTGFGGSFLIAGGKVRADLNNDGKHESFRACASNEGLHLTVWVSEPLKSKRLWHAYYYLGYDVDPNCTEKDYEK